MRKSFFRILRRTIFGVLLVVLLVLGYGIWYFNRPLPPPIADQALFEGITYTREIYTEPRPHIVHLVEIDLNAPELGFLVTPADDIEGYDYTARTTSAFLAEFDVQLAINGDFFDPWRDNGLFDYYPHAGDGVNVRGFAASNGVIITEGYVPAGEYATLYISVDNQVSFGVPVGEIYNAVSGNTLILEGEYHGVWADAGYMTQPHPRTAVGLDAAGETLFLVVVDGRQPNYSEGVTMEELADILIRHGAYNAINLDGGGSATLVIADANNNPIVLNSPIHSRIPGSERPSANHLGIFAQPVGEIEKLP